MGLPELNAQSDSERRRCSVAAKIVADANRKAGLPPNRRPRTIPARMTTGHAPICQIVRWRRLVSPHLLWLSPNRTAADNAANPVRHCRSGLCGARNEYRSGRLKAARSPVTRQAAALPCPQSLRLRRHRRPRRLPPQRRRGRGQAGLPVPPAMPHGWRRQPSPPRRAACKPMAGTPSSAAPNCSTLARSLLPVR
jgi:hypothetical protein